MDQQLEENCSIHNDRGVLERNEQRASRKLCLAGQQLLRFQRGATTTCLHPPASFTAHTGIRASDLCGKTLQMKWAGAGCIMSPELPLPARSTNLVTPRPPCRPSFAKHPHPPPSPPRFPADMPLIDRLCVSPVAASSSTCNSYAAGCSFVWPWLGRHCKMKDSYAALPASCARCPDNPLYQPFRFSFHMPPSPSFPTAIAFRRAIAWQYGSETATPRMKIFRPRSTTSRTR
jgi:hypothetical protein